MKKTVVTSNCSENATCETYNGTDSITLETSSEASPHVGIKVWDWQLATTPNKYYDNKNYYSILNMEANNKMECNYEIGATMANISIHKEVGIADAGCTKTLVMSGAPGTNVRKAKTPLIVNNPNRET